MLYKIYGSKWSMISGKFSGRSENDVKNRFYTTLKRVATRAQLEDPARYSSTFIKSKDNLVQFVDAAIMHGQFLTSKCGRKTNQERKSACEKALLFPPHILPFPILASAKSDYPATLSSLVDIKEIIWSECHSRTTDIYMNAFANMEEREAQSRSDVKQVNAVSNTIIENRKAIMKEGLMDDLSQKI